eukprot:2623247-Amphidinium_carterae.1
MRNSKVPPENDGDSTSCAKTVEQTGTTNCFQKAMCVTSQSSCGHCYFAQCPQQTRTTYFEELSVTMVKVSLACKLPKAVMLEQSRLTHCSQ